MPPDADSRPAAGPVADAPGVEAVVRVRRATLALLEGVPQEILDRRPGRRRWSAGEVADHLLLSDGIYRRDLAELFALGRSGRGGVLRRSFADLNPSVLFIPKGLLPLLEPPLAVMNLFVPAALRDRLARARWLPAQNPDAAEPRPGRPGEELRRELVESLEQTRELLRRNRDLDWTTLEHVHPLLGRHDVPGLLGFIAGHEKRHQEQLAETLEAVRNDRIDTHGP